MLRFVYNDSRRILVNLKSTTARREVSFCTITHKQSKGYPTVCWDLNIANKYGRNLPQNVQRNFSASTQHFSNKWINEMRNKSKNAMTDISKMLDPARLVDAAPKPWQPYLRLARVDKPIGTWLLYLPCTFGITLATPLGSLPDLYYLALFGVGAFMMRGAGCVINDLWDRDLDKKVERTKNRPIASGEISPRQAIGFLAGQLSISLAILLSLNTTCIAIGVLSMIPVILYPLAKRYTYYPQAVLGLTFNIGAVMGYAAVAGTVYWPTALALYAGCFSWTMYYDTVYAFQDAEDDAIAGIKSTALLFGGMRTRQDAKGLTISERLEDQNRDDAKVKLALVAFHVGALVLWMLAASTQNVAFPPFVILGAHILKTLEITSMNLEDTKGCWESFVENKRLGWAVFIGLVLGVYFGHPNRDVKKNR